MDGILKITSIITATLSLPDARSGEHRMFSSFSKGTSSEPNFSGGGICWDIFFREDRLLIHIKGGSTNANGATILECFCTLIVSRC